MSFNVGQAQQITMTTDDVKVWHAPPRAHLHSGHAPHKSVGYTVRHAATGCQAPVKPHFKEHPVELRSRILVDVEIEIDKGEIASHPLSL